LIDAPVVTLWHFSVLLPEWRQRTHACVPATLSDTALAALRRSGSAWVDPTLHGSWVVDGARYHCRPRVDRIVMWAENAA
jgi:hypothetical protein